MKRVVWLIVVVGVVILGVVSVLRKGAPRPVIASPPVAPPSPSAVANAPAISNSAPVSVVPPLAATPAEKLPKGWENFRKLREIGQLNRVTAAMENRTLPADVLAFFEKEIFNRQHWDVTRNNMANALVWQEQPNPRLHELFAKMLADETESPVWRDYCLQFLSECLKSSSDPEAIKALLARYAQGKDGLAGTAIVNIGLQEGSGRIKPDETFSQPLLQSGLTNRNRAVQMAAKGAMARIEAR